MYVLMYIWVAHTFMLGDQRLILGVFLNQYLISEIKSH